MRHPNSCCMLHCCVRCVLHIQAPATDLATAPLRVRVRDKLSALSPSAIWSRALPVSILRDSGAGDAVGLEKLRLSFARLDGATRYQVMYRARTDAPRDVEEGDANTAEERGRLDATTPPSSAAPPPPVNEDCRCEGSIS